MEDRRTIITNLLSAKKSGGTQRAGIESSQNPIQINIHAGATVNLVTYVIDSEVTGPEEPGMPRLPWRGSKRKEVYRMCYGIARQCALNAEMRSVMRQRWGAKSLRELSDKELLCLLSFLKVMKK